jgi:xanthine/uracil/vitamin C permease (AzgA family)
MSHSYARLGLALGVSLLLMFLLTMSMVRSLDHYHLNLSNFYMALIMVAPMGLVMLVVMWGMFKDRRLNAALIVGFVLAFIGALALGRSEAFVGDEQFLRSMIPHHSRAILVCQESSITDPEIAELCDQIVRTQRDEIAQMESILERMGGSAQPS